MNNFKKLITAIGHVHQQLQAAGAVNRALTLQNRLTGYSIAAFEQKGMGRAKYGQQLLNKIAAAVKINGISATNLKLFQRFYLAYPQMSQTVSDQLLPLLAAIQNNYPTATSSIAVSSERVVRSLSFPYLAGSAQPKKQLKLQ